LVGALCEHEFRCCDTAELGRKFGAAAVSIEACRDSLVDALSQGISPNFPTDDAPLLALVADLASARSANPARYSIEHAGLGSCLASLQNHACPKFEAAPHCKRGTFAEPACALAHLLLGTARDNDECDATARVPECGAGLICKAVNGRDRCAKRAAVGDGCQLDTDCNADELFCNPSSTRCEQRHGLGEACVYLDMSSTADNGKFINPAGYQTGSDIGVECARGLVCGRPNVCVEACEHDAACDAKDDTQCADGLVCHSSVNVNGLAIGWCGEPYAEGYCTRVAECTGTCGILSRSSFRDFGNMCFEFLPVGQHCSRLEYRCALGSGCASDSTCARRCQRQADCEAGRYCEPRDTNICQPQEEVGTSCGSGGDVAKDLLCKSGYCEVVNGVGTCQAKASLDGACPSNDHAQCSASPAQWCRSQLCANTLAAGADCTDMPDAACGPAAFCQNRDGSHICTNYPREGEACDPASGLVCGAQDLLACIDGHCFREHERFPGTICDSDDQCKSGFCAFDTSRCAERGGDGDACTIRSQAVVGDSCRADLYCDADRRCARRRSVGQPCDPGAQGRDCLFGGALQPGHCVAHDGSAMCDVDALAPKTLLCDG
jgi:hypothetical protein